MQRRLEGIYDEPRAGAPRTITDEDIGGVIVKTLETLPPGETQLEYADDGGEGWDESYDCRPPLAHV